MIPLTAAQVASAAGARMAEAERFLPFLHGACKAFEITTPKRLAAFLAQIGHESAGFTRLEENLNYSVDALLSMFGRHRISVSDAKKYGRTPYQKAHQEAIANCIYGGSWGAVNLGNVIAGDGWLYRGRGLKQLTGRSNYRACGIAIGEDFITTPDQMLMPVNAALSAAWFWDRHGLNDLADRGDMVGATKIINGGVNGLSDRLARYDAGLQVFA